VGGKNPRQPRPRAAQNGLGPMMNGSLGMLSNEEAAKAWENKRQPRLNPLMESLGPMMNGSLGLLSNEEAAQARYDRRQPRQNPLMTRFMEMFPGFASKMTGGGVAPPQQTNPRDAIIQSLMGGQTVAPNPGGYGYGR
jgi:hypothetical protein